MLVGKPPFEGSTPVVLMHCHLNEPPPRPSAKVQEIPKALDELVVTLMAKSPADRPWDAAAVGMKLTELRDKAEQRRADRHGLADPGGRRQIGPSCGQRAGARRQPAAFGRRCSRHDDSKEVAQGAHDARGSGTGPH